MNCMKRSLLFPSVLAVALTLGFAMKAAQAQDVSMANEERSKIMKSLSDAMKDFKEVAAGGTPGSAHAAKAAELQAGVKKFLTLFPKGSDSSMIKTRAKPEIWEQWSKFESTGMEMVAALEGIEAAAKSGDKAAFAAAFKEAGSKCGSCHKPFRGPKP